MLLYGAEAWTLLSIDAVILRVFERKVSSKIFGAVRVDDISVSEPTASCMSSSRAVVRLEENAAARWVSDVRICESR